jgi:diadenosine tetraphosphate (Ap4A) HIT family hydrolase
MADSNEQFDPFQEAWNDPTSQYPLFIDVKHGFMVIPDAIPVVEHQVLVISREAIPYQELPLKRQLQMMALANLTAEHMNKVLKPKRKIGYAVWGNKIKTAHIHLLPRNAPNDGILFFQEHPRAPPGQLKNTQELLKFPLELQKAAAKQLEKLNSELKE